MWVTFTTASPLLTLQQQPILPNLALRHFLNSTYNHFDTPSQTLAIFSDRTLFCIRELRSHHVPMLKRMHASCVARLQDL
jgi:hypothetical protein